MNGRVREAGQVLLRLSPVILFYLIYTLVRYLLADRGPSLGPDNALRVLAAEDNPTNRLILAALLEPLDVDLTVAEDGLEAVAAFDRQHFDVVLMDAQMPHMNGLEAAQAIRRRETERGLARTPIIALTANVMSHQVETYMAAGMDGFVAKPIDSTKLIEAIEGVLAAAQAADAPKDAAAEDVA